MLSPFLVSSFNVRVIFSNPASHFNLVCFVLNFFQFHAELPINLTHVKEFARKTVYV
jgi:hypothetical protein